MAMLCFFSRNVPTINRLHLGTAILLLSLYACKKNGDGTTKEHRDDSENAKLISLTLQNMDTKIAVSSMAESDDGKIITVRGPIPAADAGVTLAHEHLLLFHGQINSSGTVTDETLVMDRPNETTADVSDFVNHAFIKKLLPAIGGRTIVDLSNRGLRFEKSPKIPPFLKSLSYPATIQKISVESGANIVMGAGYYKSNWHPSDMPTRTIENLENEMIRDLATGIYPTSIRSGILGEIGISSSYNRPPGDLGFDINEQKVLIAAGLTQLRTGAAISLHFDTLYDAATNKIRTDVLKILQRLGVSMDRVSVGHLMKGEIDQLYQELASQDVYLAFDMFAGFGREEDFSAGQRLIDKGYLQRILVSGDIPSFTLLKTHIGLPHIADTPDNTDANNHVGPGFANVFDRLKENDPPGDLSNLKRNLQKIFVDNTQSFLRIKLRRGYAIPRLSRYWPGDGDHVVATDLETLDMTLPFSVSFWALANKNQTNYTVLLDQSHKSAPLIPNTIDVTQGWTFQINPAGNLQFSMATGGDWSIIETSNKVRDQQWHHVVGTYTGQEMRLYVDGVLKGTKAIGLAPVRGESKLYFGSWGGSARHLAGLLDDVRIYEGSLPNGDSSTLPQPLSLTATTLRTLGTLKTGQILSATGKGPSCVFQLVMQADGNLVVYRATKALWSSATRGNPA